MVKKSSSNREKLLSHLSRKQVLSAEELSKFISGRVILRRMVDGGEIISLGAGLYSTIQIDPFTAAVIAVARYYSNVTISNFTAMFIHGLSDEPVQKIDVDIDRTTSLKNSLMQVHRVVKTKIIGIKVFEFNGEKIRIYDLERTLAEAFMLDPGGPIFFKALKRYLKLKMGKPNSEQILKYDKVLSTKVLHHIMQELASA